MRGVAAAAVVVLLLGAGDGAARRARRMPLPLELRGCGFGAVLGNGREATFDDAGMDCELLRLRGGASSAKRSTVDQRAARNRTAKVLGTKKTGLQIRKKEKGRADEKDDVASKPAGKGGSVDPIVLSAATLLQQMQGSQLTLDTERNATKHREDQTQAGISGTKTQKVGAGEAAEEADALRKKEKRKRGKLNKKERVKEKKKEKQPFRPWADKLGTDEILVPDTSVYDCWFPFNVEWPALSFDVMEPRDGLRKSFPLALSMVVGTQALEPTDNYIAVLNLDGLRRFRKRDSSLTSRAAGDSDEGGEGSDLASSSEYEQPAHGMHVEPRLRHYRAPHVGTVNRLACLPQLPTSVATYSETGKLHVYDMANELRPALVWTSIAHKGREGFALAWSPTDAGMLASGDSGGVVMIHHPVTRRGAGGDAVEVPEADVKLEGHTASVECLAWSPKEKGVLVTGSADRSLRFWEVGGPSFNLVSTYHQPISTLSASIHLYQPVITLYQFRVNLSLTWGDA